MCLCVTRPHPTPRAHARPSPVARRLARRAAVAARKGNGMVYLAVDLRRDNTRAPAPRLSIKFESLILGPHICAPWLFDSFIVLRPLILMYLGHLFSCRWNGLVVLASSFRSCSRSHARPQLRYPADRSHNAARA